jgi:hypothetical protein
MPGIPVANLKMRSFNFLKIELGALNILGVTPSKNIRQGQNNYKLLYCSTLRMRCMKTGLHTIIIEYLRFDLFIFCQMIRLLKKFDDVVRYSIDN